MNVAVMKTKAEQARRTVRGCGRTLPGAGWVTELRKEAIGAFAALGLPHRRIEEWKYTDLRDGCARRCRRLWSPRAQCPRARSKQR